MAYPWSSKNMVGSSVTTPNLRTYSKVMFATVFLANSFWKAGSQPLIIRIYIEVVVPQVTWVVSVSQAGACWYPCVTWWYQVSQRHGRLRPTASARMRALRCPPTRGGATSPPWIGSVRSYLSVSSLVKMQRIQWDLRDPKTESSSPVASKAMFWGFCDIF